VSTATVVCTQYGQVQGEVAGNFRAFRGIPFAAPPVGELRWRPPEPPDSWTGVRDATAFGNVCPQSNGREPLGNEDCLTLNVYAVNPAASSKQPVIFFIHGGGEIRGSAQQPPWLEPPPLAGHGVVVVTVQYRLGLLGFLVHPALTAESPQSSSGNYALMDLIAALQWVHDNIAEFGGDPARVMILGFSSGSLNVQALLASPAAQGLFSSAGMMSYVLKGDLIGTTIDTAYRWYADVPSALGCDTAADVIACLRDVPAETLVQSGPNSADTGWVNIEPIVVPEDPYLKLQRLGLPVPLLIGSTSDENAWTYVMGPALDESGYAAAIHAKYDPLAAGAGDTILSLYPVNDYDSPNYALNAVESDVFFTRNARNFARDVSGDGRPPVFRYLFTHRYENDPLHNAARAFHSAELPFIFGNLSVLTTGREYFPTSGEVALSDEMMEYWARFAATGDPNGAGAVQWLPYDAYENILYLDNDIVNLAGGYRNPQCDFFSTLPTRF
jgi:para-nitrobenzyl esterase